jgi:cytoskeletal protein CcmA (bactofilin family)
MSLWQKSEPEQPAMGTTTVKASPAPVPTTVPTRESSRSERSFTLGQSIHIKGELSGNEDLTIDGRVDGKIHLAEHNLTIGANGRITAEIQAKAVIVVGEVVGNITASDRVELAPSGSVQGDLRAPRVALADGSRFKGSIDMDRKGAASTAARASVSAELSELPRSAGAAKG